MKAFRIYNYEILNFNNDPVVYTSAGLTRVTSEPMRSAMRRLKESALEYIEHDELEAMLVVEGLDPASAISFLRSILVVGDIVQVPHFSDVIIYTDLPLPDSYKELLREKYRGKLTISSELPREMLPTPSPTLSIFACLNLDPGTVRSAYNAFIRNNPENGASIGFVSGSDFHLTEVHIPAIGNPCAFCTLDRIAYYERIRGSQHHWSKLWSFCKAMNVKLPSPITDELQCLMILGVIISFANKLTSAPRTLSTQDQVLLSRTLDLTNGSFTEDSSIHWPFCECLGGVA